LAQATLSHTINPAREKEPRQQCGGRPVSSQEERGREGEDGREDEGGRVASSWGVKKWGAEERSNETQSSWPACRMREEVKLV